MLENQKYIYVLCLVSVIGLTLLEGIALLKNFNGTLLRVVSILIAGIVAGACGYYKGKKKNGQGSKNNKV